MPFKDPAKTREYQRQYSQKRRHGLTFPKKGLTLKVAVVSIETAKDIQGILSSEIGAVQALEGDVIVKARTIAYLCGAALKALEVAQGADIQQQIADLQRQIAEIRERQPILEVRGAL